MCACVCVNTCTHVHEQHTFISKGEGKIVGRMFYKESTESPVKQLRCKHLPESVWILEMAFCHFLPVTKLFIDLDEH